MTFWPYTCQSRKFNAIFAEDMDFRRKTKRRRVPLRPVASAHQSHSRGGPTRAMKKREKPILIPMEYALANQYHSQGGPTTPTKTCSIERQQATVHSGPTLRSTLTGMQ